MIGLSNKGDTIIEVVLSMALLTSILFIAWGITNRATQITLAARDRTEMVNQVKEQAEIIKAQWANPNSRVTLLNYPPVQPSPGQNTNPCVGSLSGVIFLPQGARAWYLKASASSIEKVDGVKTVGTNRPYYVYVQRKAGLNPSYSDFYVRACWENKSGSTQKQESSQVIVRLNS